MSFPSEGRVLADILPLNESSALTRQGRIFIWQMTSTTNWESNEATSGEIRVRHLGRIGFFSIVLLGAGSIHHVHAQPPAAETLTGAGLFAFGGIGFAGATSDGERLSAL
jgi:hypothetical protein